MPSLVKSALACRQGRFDQAGKEVLTLLEGEFPTWGSQAGNKKGTGKARPFVAGLHLQMQIDLDFWQGET